MSIINIKGSTYNRMKRNNYLCWNDPHQDIGVHGSVLSVALQVTGLDVAQLGAHDPQVGHGLRGFLGLELLDQLVEVSNNLLNEVLRYLWRSKQ